MKGFIGTSTVLISALIIALASLSALLINVSGLLQKPETSLGGLTDFVRFSSTTDFIVSSTAIRLTASSSCASRIITVDNNSAPIRITFSDAYGERPTATTGHLITSTSTPLILTSQDIGCGAIYGIRSTDNDAALTITDTF